MSHRLPLWALAALILPACAPAPVPPTADLVILDAAIETMNPAIPQASALAARGGKIVYVGDNEHAQPLIGKSTRVLRLKGATVWPGLIDAHIHLMDGMMKLGACDLGDKEMTLQELAPIVRECSSRTPGPGWLIVRRLNPAGFRADHLALDAIVGDRPLVLFGADGHTAWTNSAGLARAQIDRKTADPADGHIGRDAKGMPTGFLADTAVMLVDRLLDHPAPETLEKLLLQGIQDVAADGITTFMEANTNAETVRTYVGIAGKKQLHARVTIALESDGSNTDAEFARLRGLRELAAAQPNLRADFIKLFEDGVMEYPTQTASMLEPYLDGHGKPTRNSGPLYFERGALSDFIRRADKEGFNVHIHAIGDRAARVALDAFGDARAQGSKRSYSMAHLELVDPKDFTRFHDLDVIACLQLDWAELDNYTVEALLPYIGPERQARLYPARSFIAAGATIAGGSDWDVSTFNPFEAMAIALSRVNPNEPERGVLGPAEKLTLHEMLAAYTINAARMLQREAEVGSLEPGKAADLIVLDRHLDDTSAFADVRATKVVYTFAGGTMVIGPDAH